MADTALLPALPAPRLLVRTLVGGHEQHGGAFQRSTGLRRGEGFGQSRGGRRGLRSRLTVSLRVVVRGASASRKRASASALLASMTLLSSAVAKTRTACLRAFRSAVQKLLCHGTAPDPGVSAAGRDVAGVPVLPLPGALQAPDVRRCASLRVPVLPCASECWHPCRFEHSVFVNPPYCDSKWICELFSATQ